MMKRPLYTRLLTKEERGDCMVTGMMLKGAEAGLTKEAAIGDIGEFGTKAVIATALLTGIPAGIVAHLLANKAKKQSLKERALMEQNEYYRDAADLIEDEMAKNRITY